MNEMKECQQSARPGAKQARAESAAGDWIGLDRNSAA